VAFISRLMAEKVHSGAKEGGSPFPRLFMSRARAKSRIVKHFERLAVMKPFFHGIFVPG
jgi:hypothetical protein